MGTIRPRVAGEPSWSVTLAAFLLREALPQLSRWYDADFQLGDPALGAHPLTASLRGEPLPQVLELLTAALAVRVERHGTAVVFYRKLRPR